MKAYQKVKIRKDLFVSTYDQCLEEAQKFIAETTSKAEALVASIRAAETGRGGR